jgi:hypothetical protein
MKHKRRDFIHFRVTPQEKKVLEYLSIIENRNPSEMMRELLREGAEKRGVAPIGFLDRYGKIIPVEGLEQR